MAKPIWVVFMLFMCCTMYSFMIQEANFEKEIPFKVFKATDTYLDPNDFSNLYEKFKLPDQFTLRTDPKDIYWIRLDLKNSIVTLKHNDTFFLKHNTFDHGAIYRNGKSGIFKKPIGQFDKNSITQKMTGVNYYSFLRLTPKDLIDNRYLILKIQRITFKEDVSNWHFYYNSFPPNKYGTIDNFFSQQMLYGIFTGICLIIWFITTSMYLMQLKREFLYYSTYLLLLFISLTGRYFGFFQFLFDSSPLQHWISQGFIFSSNIAYGYFLIAYLNTKEDYPILHYACLAAIISNIALLVLIGFFYSFNYIDGLVFLVGYCPKLLNLYGLFACILLFLIYRGTLMYIVLTATMVLCLAFLARYYLADPKDGLYIDSLKYTVVGASIEVVIFAFGLNYKSYLEFRENYMLREEVLINKIKALRAQINPHFIFNALSSIQHLVLNNNNPSALNYLTKFSRLMRNVLESSIKTNILLSEEIKILKDYLGLESLRFNNSFTYDILIDEHLNEHEHEIPSMILQPFVENAIVHGLLPKKEGIKKLLISFKKEGDNIVCEIDDTGVGRYVAIKNQCHYKKERKSRGLEVTKRRLESMGAGLKNIEIIDKFDEFSQPTGTRVIVKIPLQNFLSLKKSTF